MPALAPATVQSLQRTLYAYLESYGGGESMEQVRAIAGSILSVQARAGDLVNQGMEIEAWVDQLVEGFEPGQVAARAWSQGEQAIAQQVNTWRETLEVKARATLDAYIQRYTPDLNLAQIQETIAAILPIVEDAQITRDEARRLIHTVGNQFDWRAAVSRVIDPKWVTLAEKTAQCLRNRDVIGSVKDVMHAYIGKFSPALVDIGEGLVEEALSAVLKSKVAFDLDIDLDAESQRLVVQQVSFQIKFLEASPPPSKTAQEIAQQVHAEVERYRREQGIGSSSYLPPVTRTDADTGGSALGGEMSIGIELQPSSDSQSPQDAPKDKDTDP